jgi:hypothetical protein
MNWLGQSDRGILVMRRQSYAIDYLEGGPAGQGRIRIEPAEVERLREAMRVRPRNTPLRQVLLRRATFPGITVALVRPSG